MGSPSFFSLLFCFYIFARPHISNCRTYEIYVTCVIDPEGRPGLIGVIRSKLLPSTRIFIHIRPSILDPDPRPDRPGNYVTMLLPSSSRVRSLHPLRRRTPAMDGVLSCSVVRALPRLCLRLCEIFTALCPHVHVPRLQSVRRWPDRVVTFHFIIPGPEFMIWGFEWKIVDYPGEFKFRELRLPVQQSSTNDFSYGLAGFGADISDGYNLTEVNRTGS